MTTYQVLKIYEPGGDVDEIFRGNLDDAQKAFNKQLENDASDSYQYYFELNRIKIDEDGETLDIETIESQVMYSEGTIDRNNYRGEHALEYGYEARYVASSKELEYTFFFQGEEEDEKVLESKLNSWYYNGPTIWIPGE